MGHRHFFLMIWRVHYKYRYKVPLRPRGGSGCLFFFFFPSYGYLVCLVSMSCLGHSTALEYPQVMEGSFDKTLTTLMTLTGGIYRNQSAFVASLFVYFLH